MPILSQKNRLARIKTPLAADTFIVSSLDGEESLFDIFKYDVGLQSDNHAVKHADLLGKSVTLSVYATGENSPRYIHGYVNSLRMMDINDDNLRNYTISVVPGLWFSSLNSQNRIFHRKTAKDIIGEVLGAYSSVLKFKFSLTGTLLTREYCVQFNESDFDFVSRLLAEEGITYFFKHEDGNHQLTFVDDVQGFFDCDIDALDYDGGGSQPTKNSIHSWERNFSYHTGNSETTDYNEFATTNTYKVKTPTTSPLNASSSYMFRHFGAYRFELDADHKHTFKGGDNTQRSKTIIEAEEGRFDVAVATSDCSALAAGGRFTIEHPIASEQGTYIVSRLVMSAREGNGKDTFFQNEFECVPSNKLLRPLWRRPLKTIDAPQVAVVEEVKATASNSSSDPYTQIKVKFPWHSEQSSCWMRVAQSFAGRNWGASFVPRIGQEVIVSYINGDPSRPLITGAVYNGTNEGPNYTVTQSGWKTQYEASACNELRFDDKPDGEELYMEAGKDHNWIVHNDQNGTVENNQTLKVVKDRTVTVTEGNEKIAINKGNRTIDVDEGNYQTTVAKGDYATTISKGKHTTTVSTGDCIETVSKGKKKVDIAQGDYSLSLGQGNRMVSLKAGNHTVKASAGKYSVNAKGGVVIESLASIEIKCGASSIKLTPAGVTIKGTMLSCKGDATAEVKAGAMLTLKGGITMIN